MPTLLQEPILRFWALLHEIPRLEAAADYRALLVAGLGANPGEKAAAFNKYLDALAVRMGQDAHARSVPMEQRMIPGVTPGVSAVEVGALAQERAARAARAKEVEREWKRKLGRPTE